MILALTYIVDTIEAKNANVVEKAWFRNNAFVNNPAANFQISADSLMYIKSGYLNSFADHNMMLVEEGSSFESFYIQSTSFKREGSMFYFGKASYESSKNRNTTWSNVENHQLLGPYIIADSVGGDYLREKYAIEGGVSKKHENIEWGIRAIYNGVVAYRQIDPRPRNTVSELSIQPGINFRKNNFGWGFSPLYHRYRQAVEIHVEKEKKLIYIYSAKGLGQYHWQLSDFYSSYSRSYRAETYAAATQMYWNKNRSATIIQLKNSHTPLKVIESDERIPFQTKTYNHTLEVSHEQTLGRKTLFFDLELAFQQKIGRETQFNSIQINNIPNIWVPISESDRYLQTFEKAGLSMLITNTLQPNNTMWQRIALTFTENKEQYFEPDVKQLISRLSLDATWGVNSTVRKNNRDYALRIQYLPVLTSVYDNYSNSTFAKAYNEYNFNVLSKTIYAVGINAIYNFNINKSLSVSLTANIDYYFDENKNSKLITDTNISFYF